MNHRKGFALQDLRSGAMLVRGKRCPLLGRVTMDLMVIDVSDLLEAAAGDEVVLMGRQGDEEISATELAGSALILNVCVPALSEPRL